MPRSPCPVSILFAVGWSNRWGVLAAILVVAAGYRALEAPRIGRTADGALAITDPDACYHLRRAALTLETGLVPTFDRFLNAPEGSPCPWPPLFDRVLAGTASVLGGLDRAALVLPVLLGVLACAVAFGLGRRLFGPRVGLLAALVLALLPAARQATRAGMADHHGAAQLLWVLLAWAGFQSGCPDGARSRLAGVLVGLVAAAATGVQVASLAPLALWAACLWVWAIASPAARRGALEMGACAMAVWGACLWWMGADSGWVGTLQNLSPLHGWLGLGAAGVFAVSRAAVAGFTPPLQRAWLILAPVLALGPAAASARGREIVSGAWAWVAGTDPFMSLVGESQALLAGGQTAWMEQTLTWLFPVGLAIWARELTLPHFGRRFVALAALGTGAMALAQRRFGVLHAPFLAVGAAAAVSHALAWATAKSGRGRTWALAGVAVALVVAVRPAIMIVAGQTVAGLGWAEDPQRALRVERVTALRALGERAGGNPLADPLAEPPPRVMSPWGLGHVLAWHAGVPGVAVNFGRYVGEENWRDAARFLVTSSADEGLGLMAKHGARWVVVESSTLREVPVLRQAADRPHEGKISLAGRLMKQGGSGVFYLRLVDQSAGTDAAPDGTVIPLWRVFELVAGARVGFPSEWRARVRGRITVSPPRGEPFEWWGPARQEERPDGTGRQVLHVPYAGTLAWETEDGRSGTIEITDRDVTIGLLIEAGR